jgi:RNA-binding protein YlmH
LSKVKTSIPKTLRVQGREVALEEVPLERVASGSRKRLLVIVPSLRVDALGAKAFNVSRSYFSKGISAGNVTINGKRAEKSSSAEAGDEIYAETIGRMYVASVQGETRRGNLKVFIDIEKA